MTSPLSAIARAYCEYPIESLALATVLSYSLARESGRKESFIKAEFLFALGRYLYGDHDWQVALRDHGYSPTQATPVGPGESYDRS